MDEDTESSPCPEGAPSTRDPLRATYPALWQFLGAYLHQDWRDDYADPSEALRDFMVGEPALAPELASEIDQMLGSTHTASETEASILELGSFYVPSAVGQDPRQWLRSLRQEAGHFPV